MEVLVVAVVGAWLTLLGLIIDIMRMRRSIIREIRRLDNERER